MNAVVQGATTPNGAAVRLIGVVLNQEDRLVNARHGQRVDLREEEAQTEGHATDRSEVEQTLGLAVLPVVLCVCSPLCLRSTKMLMANYQQKKLKTQPRHYPVWIKMMTAPSQVANSGLRLREFGSA